MAQLKDGSTIGGKKIATPEDVLILIGDKVKIEFGSYIGTGTFGVDNPNSLTFSFAPKAVIFLSKYCGADGTFSPTSAIYGNSKSAYFMQYVPALMTTYKKGGGFGMDELDKDNYLIKPSGKRSEDGKTVTWYHSLNASDQFNASNYTYYYMAIG